MFSWCSWICVTIPYHCSLALLLCGLKPDPGSWSFSEYIRFPDYIHVLPASAQGLLMLPMGEHLSWLDQALQPFSPVLCSFVWSLLDIFQSILIRSLIIVALQILFTQPKFEERNYYPLAKPALKAFPNGVAENFRDIHIHSSFKTRNQCNPNFSSLSPPLTQESI